MSYKIWQIWFYPSKFPMSSICNKHEIPKVNILYIYCIDIIVVLLIYYVWLLSVITADENNIGAPEMKNNFWWTINLLIFPILLYYSIIGLFKVLALNLLCLIFCAKERKRSVGRSIWDAIQERSYEPMYKNEA